MISPVLFALWGGRLFSESVDYFTGICIQQQVPDSGSPDQTNGIEEENFLALVIHFSTALFYLVLGY